MNTKIRAAVVGLGYWGPNLARNFNVSSDFDLVALCDSDPSRLDRAGATYPSTMRSVSMDEMLASAKPELVAIATPVASHHPLALKALRAGAHVLCEKPLAATARDAEEMCKVASDCGRHLFVEHTFNFTAAVRTLRQLYTVGTLGDLFYVDSVRINLGLFQPDVDVTWDLAPHDLSILSFVLGRRKITHVNATGSSHNPRGFKDVAYVHLDYGHGFMAHLHLSWLSPVKVRRTIFSGSRSSCIYDDMEASEKIKIYDHGVSFAVDDIEERSKVLVNYRRGEMRAPAIENTEALSTELAEIAAHIRVGRGAAAVGEEGLEIVRVLEAIQVSLNKDGARVTL